MNSGRAEAFAERSRAEAERNLLNKRIDGLHEAISEGFRTAGLLEKLESMELRRSELDKLLSKPAPTTLRLHPNISQIYRRKVEDLAQTLQDPSIRAVSLTAIRSLIKVSIDFNKADKARNWP